MRQDANEKNTQRISSRHDSYRAIKWIPTLANQRTTEIHTITKPKKLLSFLISHKSNSQLISIYV